MRRLIAAALLAAAMISVIVTGNRITAKYCSDLKNWIMHSKEQIYAKDWSNAEKSVSEYIAEWESKEKTLSAFINRQALDDISVSLNQLLAAAEAKDLTISSVMCAEIESSVKEIEEKEQFGLISFF